MTFPDLVGTIGVIIIIIVYFLLQIGRMRADGFLFSLINALGALMIIYSLMHKWNLASFLMEGTWFIISLFGVVKFFWERR